MCWSPGGRDVRVSGPAIWMAPYGEALRAGHNVQKKGVTPVKMALYADIRNPLMLDNYNMLEWAHSAFETSRDFPFILKESEKAKLIAEGYDGVIYGPKGHTEEILAFNSEQVKSADPVTYDKRGNVVPISQRFNPKSPLVAALQAKPPAREIELSPEPDSIRKLGEDVLGREVASSVPLDAMDGGMLSALKNDKVKSAVVPFIPVDVVDVL